LRYIFVADTTGLCMHVDTVKRPDNTAELQRVVRLQQCIPMHFHRHWTWTCELITHTVVVSWQYPHYSLSVPSV